MRRRELIMLFGGAAATLPFAVRAQNAVRTARIGYLNSVASPLVDAALTEGLRDLGWVEGKNLSVERRVCFGDAECLMKSAAELVELRVDVIVAEATASTQAAKAATSSIPIVFVATGETRSDKASSLASRIQAAI